MNNTHDQGKRLHRRALALLRPILLRHSRAPDDYSYNEYCLALSTAAGELEQPSEDSAEITVRALEILDERMVETLSEAKRLARDEARLQAESRRVQTPDPDRIQALAEYLARKPIAAMDYDEAVSVYEDAARMEGE